MILFAKVVVIILIYLLVFYILYIIIFKIYLYIILWLYKAENYCDNNRAIMDLYFKVLKLFPLILNLSSITMALNLRFIMEDSYIQLLIFSK